MAMPAAVQSYTPEEYLALERSAEVKSEYIDGQIVMMTGARKEHNTVTVNLVMHVGPRLRGGPCGIYAGDMRVRVADTDLYTYPDVIVVCGDPVFEDAELDTLLNPTVLFEILSPTTERYDRGEKFARYRRLASLREYVLVSQDRPRVEHYLRQGDVWVFTAVDGLGAAVTLPTLDISVALRDIYERIEFPPEE